MFNLNAPRNCTDFTNCQQIKEENQKSEQETRNLLRHLPNAQSSSDDDDDDDDGSESASENEEEQMDDAVIAFLDDDGDDNDAKEEIEPKNRMESAKSKVERLVNGIKEKANKNKQTLREKMRFNLFRKPRQYIDGHVPYSLQMNNFSGHRTVETVKECNFFGPRSEFVISGSDCGHAFIWRKSDGKIVNIIKGDGRITNVVQGNPVNCSLVTSGLDSTVKLFTPTSDGVYKDNESDERKEKWVQVVEENKRESQNSRRPIPMSLLVYLLRRGLYGFDTDDDDEEEDDDDMKDDDESEDDDVNGADDEEEATLTFLEE